MREMNQLVNTEDSAWPIIQNWLKDATNHTELLPVNKDLAETALYQLQVTTKSPMGALVYGSGGLLIDNGWLRIAGSGHPRLPRDPVSWTQRPEFAGVGNDSNLLIVFYVQIMPDDFVMQLHRF